MFHIGIRLYLWLWMPAISAVMNGWYMRNESEYYIDGAKSELESYKKDTNFAESNAKIFFNYIPDRFDWQATPLVTLKRIGGDCEDWSAWWRAIYPGGKIYRLYNPVMKRGHAVYVVENTLYDQKDIRTLCETNPRIKDRLEFAYDYKYTVVI